MEGDFQGWRGYGSWFQAGVKEKESVKLEVCQTVRTMRHSHPNNQLLEGRRVNEGGSGER